MLTRPFKSALPAFVAALFLALPLRAMTVGTIRLERARHGYLLKIATSSQARPRLEALSGRVLIVVPGGRRGLKTLYLGTGPVARVRFGRSGSDLRLVLDLRAKASARLEDISARGFEVVLEPSVPAPVSAAAAASTPAAPVSPKTATPAGLADMNPARVGYTYRVVDLSLGGDERHSRLVVSADGPANYSSSVRGGGRLLRLEFRDSSLAWSGNPAALKDDSISSVVVKDILVEGESRVRVDIHLTGVLNYAFRRDQNQLVVSLERPAPVVPPPAPGDLDTPVSLDVQDADLVGVLKALCEQAGFNYQFTRTLLTKTPPDSQVTMKAENRPFHEVLDTLLAQVQCRAMRLGNTIYMGTQTEIDSRRDSLPVVTGFYTPRYLTQMQLLDYLDDHYQYDQDELARVKKAVVRDDRDPSRLCLTGTADEVKVWTAYLKVVDVPESSTDDSGGDNGQPHTQVFHLDYLDNSNASLINGAIAQLYPDGETPPTPLIDAATRTMVVTTTTHYLREIAGILAKIDVRPLQVNIEGKIVEVDQSVASQIGINWTALATPNTIQAGGSGGTVTPAGYGSFNSGVAPSFASSFTIGTIVNQYNIGAILAQINALVEDNKAEIVTAPNITTIDNQSATLGLIQTQVYEQQTSTITNGVAVNTYTYPTSNLPLTLVVTPKISRKDHRVLMNINFQLTSPNGQPLQVGAPVPTEQEEAVTNVSVDSGDTYVIGGLVTQDNSSTVYKVPFLGDIPLLGLLFRYTSISKVKKDIIVFIKPTIVVN